MKIRVLSLILILLTGGATAQTLSKEDKEKIFISAKAEFSRHYPFAEHIAPTIADLDKQWAEGKYGGLSNRSQFTDSLAAGFRHLTHDGHLNFFHQVKETAKTGAEAQQVPWHLLNPNFLNNGLTGVQILPGDIGYLRIQAFGSFDELLPAAFTFVKNTQALIIDIRGNGGGMLSNGVISYLLPPDSIHLVTIRWNNRTDSIRTIIKLNGPRYLERPVYVLTDKGTFSSAEEFAYDLQALKRATVIGERSGGGANPGGAVPVYTFNDGARVDFFVPMGRVENAITKANWEGQGVSPDIETRPQDALHKAQSFALKTIKESQKDAFLRKQYDEILRRHETGK